MTHNQCQGITLKGYQCLNKTRAKYCHIHQPCFISFTVIPNDETDRYELEIYKVKNNIKICTDIHKKKLKNIPGLVQNNSHLYK